MRLPPLSAHALETFWIQITAVLAAAHVLGALARRFGLPAVVGELSAGLLLGPSVFGIIWPAGFHRFLPTGSESWPLATLTTLSLVIVLMMIGTRTDLRLIRHLGRAAASVSMFSLIVPAAGGIGLALMLPHELLGRGDARGIFTLVIAATVAVSSLPVIAKVIQGLGRAAPRSGHA